MIQDVLEEKRNMVDKALDSLIQKEYEFPSVLYEAIRYSLFSGGKRLRPALLLMSFDAASGAGAKGVKFAGAIEMIHTYSLIHDDLPALDNDDLRRGRATNHKMFGEDIAILAGDALLNTAYEVMAEEMLKSPDEQTAKAMAMIAKAAGTKGMIGGQVADVISEGNKGDAKTLSYIQLNKTAALIAASVASGAVLAGADAEVTDVLYDIGEKIGVAFQIQDDILDVAGSTEELGKLTGSDEKNDKLTDVKVYGLEESGKRCQSMFREAIAKAETLDKPWHYLIDFIEEISSRKK